MTTPDRLHLIIVFEGTIPCIQVSTPEAKSVILRYPPARLPQSRSGTWPRFIRTTYRYCTSCLSHFFHFRNIYSWLWACPFL